MVRNYPGLRVCRLLLLAAAAWCLATAAMAEVTARVDRNQLIVGETLTLVLQTNDARQALDADLGALEGDFAVLDRRSETQMSIVNGRQSAVVRLMVTLEPLRAGRLVIPALEVGGHRTQPIVVHVEAAPEPAPGEPEPVFIEVELNPRNGPYYVHAQIGLTVRLFYQQTLTEAAISQPEADNAAVRLLDEVPFQAERGGHRYRVLERRYAVFPERSGTLVIPPLRLTGRLADRRGERLWEPSLRGRRISVESDALTVEVAPRPPGFSGQAWQPARAYSLSEQVSAIDELHVGEPVTRTILVDAVGLEENMIAEPPVAGMPNARIYPDQPQGISRDDGEWVLGHKEFRYAIVPETEGELVLPELRVAWWDTVADEERVAVLPAHRIEVLPSAAPEAARGRGFSPPAAPPLSPSVDSGSGYDPDIDPGLGPDSDPGPGPDSDPGYWRWLTLLFAGLWLATLAVMFGLRRRSQSRSTPQADAGEAEIAGRFLRACRDNDAAAARGALRTWLIRFEPPGGAVPGRFAGAVPGRFAGAVPGQFAGPGGSLLDFAARCGDAALGRAIRELDAAGFRPGRRGGWDGNALGRAWQAWRHANIKRRSRSTPPITDLYAPENRRRHTAA